MISCLLAAALVSSGLTDVDRPWTLEAPRQKVVEHVPGVLWIEAENFADYGGWLLDTQFAHKMGSGYLLAPGVGEPVGAASTRVDIGTAGEYRVWVRTKDWVPEHHPGRFALAVAGRRLEKTFGASGRDWSWEDGGTVRCEAGSVELKLVDVSGSYARCDAVVLSRDPAFVPAEDPAKLAEQRAACAGEPVGIADGGCADVVVVGGGPAGVPAALAAARHGARVTLLQDRPVLGGNVSSELGVLLNGAAGHPGYREGGIIEEAVLRKAVEAKGHHLSFSRVFARMVAAETNLTTVLNARVVGVEKQGDRISAVLVRDPLTGARARYRGNLFVDATGDGWLGCFAGAKYMFGREGAAAFGESCAPEKPDLTTMSGCLLGGYGLPRLKRVKKAKPYETPVWARVLPEGFYRKADGLKFKWWLEHPGEIDDCRDPEKARDELIRIFFAYWGWLKNDCADPMVRKLAAVNDLLSLPYMNGRREGMRLTGDLVFTENDALSTRVFEDAIGHTGWALDTHDPLGVQNPRSSGFWRKHPKLPRPTGIPYRILYSANVPNLFMAGRNVSCSHVGLGTLRVSATCAVMGQAVGTAAAGCVRTGKLPREYGCDCRQELQRALLRDDQFIPGLRLDDPSNVAAGGRAAATSERRGDCAANVLDGWLRTLPGEPSREWVSSEGLPQAVTVSLPMPAKVSEIRVVFDSDFYIEPKWVKHTVPKTLAKAYSVEVTADGKTWKRVARRSDNDCRLAIHRFAARTVSAIRVTVTETYGDPCARVFEIMAFAIPSAGAASAEKAQGPTCPAIRYGERRAFVPEGAKDDRLLDIHLPTNAAPAAGYPCVMWIHGGSFMRGGRKLSHMCYPLLRAGYALIGLEYCLYRQYTNLVSEAKDRRPKIDPKWPYPKTVRLGVDVAAEDAELALAWIAKHGAEYKLDPSRVVLMGSSAGAITCLEVAYVRRKQTGVRIRGVVDFCGSVEDVSKVVKPVPPLLIFHGDSDMVVGTNYGREMKRRLDELGVRCEAHWGPGVGHGIGRYAMEHNSADLLRFVGEVTGR